MAAEIAADNIYVIVGRRKAERVINGADPMVESDPFDEEKFESLQRQAPLIIRSLKTTATAAGQRHLLLTWPSNCW